MALADLLTVPAYQVRASTDDATVRRYAAALRAGAELPPVKAGRINGALVLLDGFHRVGAHRLVGNGFVEAEIIPTTEREARWLAAEANMTHGLPLKRAERHEAFKAFVRADRHRNHRGHLLSLREAAKAFGLVGHTTFLSWMRKFFPRIAAQYDGPERLGQGARALPLVAPDLSAIASDSLAQAVAAARGVRDPADRGGLVRAFREAAAEVERGGAFRIIPEDF